MKMSYKSVNGPVLTFCGLHIQSFHGIKCLHVDLGSGLPPCLSILPGPFTVPGNWKRLQYLLTSSSKGLS